MVRPEFLGRRVADIFDEVRDDLRAERAQNMLRRYGAVLVIAAVLVVLAAAGWQAWRWRQNQQASAVATTFLDAMSKSSGPQADATGGTPTRDAAAAAFATVAAEGPEGYRTLARLRAAALRATSGDTKSALQMWDDVNNDPNADPLLRNLASLLWAQNQLDQGEPSAVEAHLALLNAPGNPWRPLAIEAQALLSLRTGQDGRARDLLKQLSTDQMAPTGARARAGAMLTRMGEPPAPDPTTLDPTLLAPGTTPGSTSTEIGG